MAKFKVLRGAHSEGTDARGRQAIYGPGQPLGDIVETDNDLTKHNRPGLTRFLRLEDEPVAVQTPPVSPVVAASVVQPAVEQEPVEEDGLEQLTVAKLQQLAENEEIDLGQGSTKAQIINTIRAARVAV